MCHELSYWRSRERAAAKAETKKQQAPRAPAPEPVKEPVAKLKVVEPA